MKPKGTERKVRPSPPKTRRVANENSPSDTAPENQENGGAEEKFDRSKLRRISRNEAISRCNAAEKAKKLHRPSDLRTEWERPKRGIGHLVHIFRDYAKSTRLDDSESARRHLPWAVVEIVRVFEALVGAGEFRDVLPRLIGLPLLYSPSAGKGAGGWERARDLWEMNKMGAAALTKHRGTDSCVARNPTWGQLAEAAVGLARWAAMQFRDVAALRSRAVEWAPYEKRRPKAQNSVSGWFYFFEDGTVLAWPAWLDLCKNLPARVSDDTKAIRIQR